jgi:hypothetical protein
MCCFKQEAFTLAFSIKRTVLSDMRLMWDVAGVAGGDARMGLAWESSGRNA